MNLGTGTALAILIFLTTSCAHTRYQEPNLGDTANIEANAPAWIHAIDGRKIRAFGSGKRTSFKISPGPHTVQVFYDDYDFFTMQGKRVRSLSYLDLKFLARPSHNYFVVARAERSKWSAMITEFPDTNPK
jgi:hypothetical protein